MTSTSMPNLGSGMKKEKITTAAEAVRLIPDGAAVAFGGFVATGLPEEMTKALEKSFLETGHPKDLTLLYSAGQAGGHFGGLDRLTHKGLLKKVIGSHFSMVPGLQEVIRDNRVQGYNLPLGCIAALLRDTAAGRPGLITKVGLGTFVDPRQTGGKLNQSTTEDIVELMEIDGEEYLRFKPLTINVAVIRGTTADSHGNITMEKEAFDLDHLAMATAVRNQGGIVICQVERIAERGSLNPRDVRIPGILVDCVVKAEPDNHWLTGLDAYDAALTGEIRMPQTSVQAMDLSVKKIIGRRASFELTPNSVVNLGIGIPETVASVAAEEKILDYVTLTTEPGVIGGLPSSSLRFGTASNTEAIVPMANQFDFYDGGGLDVTFLGMAQVDKKGNVNVSRFGPKFTGAGGFINISQNARKVVFTGTMTAGGFKASIDENGLKIQQEGKVHKFVDQVEEITFSGELAAQNGRPVYYVTERAVFRLGKNGPELIEIAPGLDLGKDILAHMDFKPVIPREIKIMDKRLFAAHSMGLINELFAIPNKERLTYDPATNFFFVNLEFMSIKSNEQIEDLKEALTNKLSPVGHKVQAIVNYDNFFIMPDLVDEFAQLARYLIDNFYASVTRYTTNAFMRMKLGDALEAKKVPVNLFETKEQAARLLTTE